ncbi:MAG: NAD-dependent epimerase/dehydratase family protein [Actinobacteria bacterium]|nr:NAD-dependent epimerase/dehydratase family protein [Actinomycetota bacterium]
MKIAVIGGSGFIGSHVVDKLLEAGHEITVYDIMSPQKDVKHIHIDILDFHRSVISLAGNYDIFYALAAMANVNDIHKNPLENAMVNFQGLVNILEAVRRYGGRIIFASTVWVYMLANNEMVDEDTPLLGQNVNHPYTASKFAAELYIQSYNKLYNTEFTILRYGIPYGPRGRVGTVITNFISSALKRDPIKIDGDGMQYRNFIYVEDLAKGNVAALQENAKNQIFNLDGMRPVTVKEVAETVCNFIPGSKIEYRNIRLGDFKGRIASNEKALKMLGWQPTVDFKEGVKKYIDWYRNFNL